MRSSADIPPIVRMILEGRGITGDADLERFFNPSLADLVPPEKLPGTVLAADVILSCTGKIVVFGDYDCDGVCATAILVSCIRTLMKRDESTVAAFIPERLSEGYGMSDASISRMLAEHPDVALVVTVDNGINSVQQIADLKARGIQVVVTDHHLPGDVLPKADALIDPKVDSPESLAFLCGAGVAFLLANRLVHEARRRGVYSGRSIAGPLLVLAGLATVTDIMPLVGQNRILVSEALSRFRRLAPIGLRELLDRASKSAPAALTSKDFGFLIGPRINAAGRLASGMEALELILTEDREIARECARIVDARNAERKSIEQKMTEEALSKVVPDAFAQVIDLPNGHPGVAGIVAARVLEKLSGRVPVCVLAGGHGSARAPDGLNIRDAFEACRDLLDAFGGHAAAGGFSVREGALDAFRERLNDYCSVRLAEGDVTGDTVAAEAWVNPEDVTVELAEWLTRMEPFGEANPDPVFGLHSALFTDVRPLGMEGRHLLASVTCVGAKRGTPHLRAVWWNHGEDVERLRRDALKPHEILFRIELSDYGDRHAEIRLISVD